MRRFIVLVMVVATLGGCGSPQDRDGAVVAAPPPDLMATAVSSGAPRAAPPASRGDEATIDDVGAAGGLMVTARNVCRLADAELAKFTVYSEWIVNRDPQRKAVFLKAANETMSLHQEIIRQGRLEAYKRKTCPQVQRVLAVIEQDFKRNPASKSTTGAAQ